jgi:hypothetical protein
MKSSFLLALLGLVAWFAGCSSARVAGEVDSLADLSRYKTFRFIDMEETPGHNPLYHSSVLEDNIHREIALQLAKRGIEEDCHGPGILIVYHTFTEQKHNSLNNYYPMMYGGWSWRMYPWRFTPYPFGHRIGYDHVLEYTEGTLIIDAIDRKSNMLIWRGSYAGAVDGPADVSKRAVKAVRAIFKEFPNGRPTTRPDGIRDSSVITSNP